MDHQVPKGNRPIWDKQYIWLKINGWVTGMVNVLKLGSSKVKYVEMRLLFSF